MTIDHLMIIIASVLCGSLSIVMSLEFTWFFNFSIMIISYVIVRLMLRYLNGDWKV